MVERATDINIENKAREIAKEAIKIALSESTDKELVKKMGKEVAKEALFEIANGGKDRRFQDTHLLMLNYKSLKNHIESDNGCVSIEFGNNKYIKVEYRWLESIARSKARTAEMIYYIEEKLKFLEYKYKENKDEEKYKAFYMFYIEGKSNYEIQEELKCGKNSPKRWNNMIIRELSVLLWGIDAVKMHG